MSDLFSGPDVEARQKLSKAQNTKQYLSCLLRDINLDKLLYSVYRLLCQTAKT